MPKYLDDYVKGIEKFWDQKENFSSSLTQDNYEFYGRLKPIKEWSTKDLEDELKELVPWMKEHRILFGKLNSDDQKLYSKVYYKDYYSNVKTKYGIKTELLKRNKK